MLPIAPGWPRGALTRVPLLLPTASLPFHRFVLLCPFCPFWSAVSIYQFFKHIKDSTVIRLIRLRVGHQWRKKGKGIHFSLEITPLAVGDGGGSVHKCSFRFFSLFGLLVLPRLCFEGCRLRRWGFFLPLFLLIWYYCWCWQWQRNSRMDLTDARRWVCESVDMKLLVGSRCSNFNNFVEEILFRFAWCATITSLDARNILAVIGEGWGEWDLEFLGLALIGHSIKVVWTKLFLIMLQCMLKDAKSLRRRRLETDGL